MHNEMVTQADHSAEVCDCRMTVSLLAGMVSMLSAKLC
jgi:hypothetical protein